MKLQMHMSIQYQAIKHFLGSDKPKMLFFLLMKVEMPTIVGISTFMVSKNSMLSWVEHEKSFITSEPIKGHTGPSSNIVFLSLIQYPVTISTFNVLCRIFFAILFW